MATASDSLLAHVRAEVEKLEYGSVTVEVVNGRTVDVITQRRVRFQDAPARPAGPQVERRG